MRPAEHLNVPREIKPVELSRFWNGKLAPYMGANNRKAIFQFVSTLALFAVNWTLMYFSMRWSYLLTLALAVPAVGLLTRLFIFQHDCGHGSFFSSRRWNTVIGSFIGLLTLTPYHYWRRTHAVHHATSGDLDRRTLGDVQLLTVKEYEGQGFWGRLRYRAYRNPLVLFGVGPIWQFVLKHRLPLDAPWKWKKEWGSVGITNAAIAAVLITAHFTIGLKAFFMVQIPITLIGGVVGIWLFYIQHQFEDTYWREHEEWDFCRAGIQGSSYYDLPNWLHWFTGNIGFHHVHHLASRIPNYNLKRCYREVQELHRVTRLTLLQSLRCARLHLWDERTQKLVGFRDLRRLREV